MKQLILLMAAFAALHAVTAAGRSVETPDGLPLIDTLTTEPYLLADPMPSFNGGGTLDFCRWVQEHLRYPSEAVIYGIEGHVVVSFVVGADGKVSNAEALTSPDPSLSEAALFVVRRSPRWEPGKLNGRPVRVRLSIPIDFNLQRPGVKPTVVTQLPKFRGGGLIDFKHWVLRNVEFSDKTFYRGDEGWVEVSFSVNGKGKVRGVETTRFSDPDFAYQIQRTIASSPLWTPLSTDGKQHNVDFRLRFDLLLQRGPDGLYSEDNTVYTTADSLPRFCGGSPGVFREWVRRQVDSLLDPGAAVPKVRVNVRFVIEPDGTMSCIKVSAPKEHSGFARLVRLAVDKTPLWTPAVAGGEKVRFRISQMFAFGQEEELGENPDSLDVMPKYQNGGLPEFRQWVMQAVEFPREALELGIEGRVVASFVVEPDGTVSSVRIIRSPDPILSREVVRVLAESPKWTPGSKGGEPVRVKYTLPVDFRGPVKPGAAPKPEFGPSSGRYTPRP